VFSLLFSVLIIRKKYKVRGLMGKVVDSESGAMESVGNTIQVSIDSIGSVGNTY